MQDIVDSGSESVTNRFVVMAIVIIAIVIRDLSLSIHKTTL